MPYTQPNFLKKIDEKFRAGAGNIFLVHGNIHDVFPTRDGNYKPLLPLLAEELSKENRIFIHLDLSGGFTVLPVWPSSIEDLPEKDKQELSQLTSEQIEKKLSAKRLEHQLGQIKFLRSLFKLTPDIETLSREWTSLRKTPKEQLTDFDILNDASIHSSFAALLLAKEIFEKISEREDKDSRRLIFLLNDVGTIAPAQNEANLSENDRRNIQLLEKWFSMSEFVASRHTVIMVNDALEGVNPKLRNLPQITPIKIKRPTTEERLPMLERLFSKFGSEIEPEDGLSVSKFAEETRGLTLRDIEQVILTEKSKKRGTEKAKISLNSIKDRAREILEQTLSGHIKFLELDGGLETVIGQKKLVIQLQRLARLFQKGIRAALPNAILVTGPNGSGKTYIFKRFCKDTERLTVVLQKTRSMWYGETERIWELIEEILETLGMVNILVDEGDTELGGRGREVHEVDKRLFGKILRIMENKNNKGRLCWIIITARADLLEPDIKRSGRAGRHYPVFAPETQDEKEEFIEKALLNKFGLSLKTITAGSKERLSQLTLNYYPTDFDQLVEQVEEIKASSESGEITVGHIIEEASFLMPADPVLQRKLQIYVALLECTDLRLIPDQYQDLAKDREKLVKEILRLKQLTGESI